MLVGLTGRAGVGKDYVANRIRALRPYDDVVVVGFADALKASAAAALGVDLTFLDLAKREPGYRVIVRTPGGRSSVGITVRQYLQRYGTEAHRDVFGEDFWVDHLRPTLRDHAGKIVVVTDVRFHNEARAITEEGGTVALVIGPSDDDAGGHVSENPIPWSALDFIMYNSQRDDDPHLDTQVNRLLRRA